ncbi:LPS biosynthesis protein [Moraxella osloensis]|uniref:LPS-assembly protein LptD n=1 Tax=Faucicola osloensis TaxID=34062 RepID=A0AA91FHM8_FAUOS|nr:LPS assembly protein LptD [Moraxella osloensis]OBX62304.1 LPS biosynthesis protein [Moraxella osloensis]
MKKFVKLSPISSTSNRLTSHSSLPTQPTRLHQSLHQIYRHTNVLAMTLGAMFTTLYSTSALAVLPTAAVTKSTDAATAQSTKAQNIEAQSTEAQNIESQSIKKQNLDTSAATPDTDGSTDSSIATTADNATTVDVTTNQGITPISAPDIKLNSARTRPNFTPNQQQQASLDKLKTFYQPKTQQTTDDTSATVANPTSNPNLLNPLTPDSQQSGAQENTQSKAATRKDAMCHGNWVYPTSTIYQQQALAAAATDQPNSSFPIYASADYGYYDNENYAELSGDVQINQGRQQISADKVVVNVQDGIAAAQGNVLLVDAAQSLQSTDGNPRVSLKDSPKGGLITVADELAYQTDSSKATAKDVAFASVPLQAYGYAKRLNKVDESRVEIDDVMFTTCAPDNPTWQINAKNIDINTDTGRGEAYNATLKVKNTPVLYLPYFNFPIDDRRTSGFLLPRGGFSTEGSFNVQLPYYFNLAPNYDATVTPTIFTDRNPMLTGEFRYLTEKLGYGSVLGSYLPNDKQYNDEDRTRFYYNHHWQSKDIPNLSIDALYQYVSDPKFLNDFETLGDETVQLNLPRRIQANYYNDYLTALAKIETFQTLDRNLTDSDKILDKDKPYDRLPQLSVKYRVPWVTQFDLTGISDFAYFKRPINDGSAPEQSGGRLYNKLTAAYPMMRTWGYVTPSISLQHLYTQFDQESADANGLDENSKSQSIFVPQFSIDSGLNFFKTGTPFGKFDESLGGYQLLSPRLKYVYSPYKDQTDVPNFNTRLASLNFSQLYEDSWFLGYDRLPDNNHLTPSLNYRYIDGNGLTRLDASVGKQIYLSDIRVHLDNTDDGLKIDNTGTVFEVSTQPRQDFWVDLDGSVDDNADLNYINTQFRYAPTYNSLYNLGYIKRNESRFGQKALSAFTGSAVLPINDNWQFLGAVQYDNEKSRFSDVLAGFTYDSCCYGLSIYARRYYDELSDKDSADHAIMAEISLNGLSNKGDGRLASLMRNRVLGYDPRY